MSASNDNDFKITEKSQVVNMVDVNTIYGENGDFRSCVDTISNVIIPELERLADSNVIQYGNVGTRPMFNRLIDDLNGLVKMLDNFTDDRVTDFTELKASEEAELQKYSEYLARHKRRSQGPTHTVNSGSEIMEVW